jgi:hypothetical protein
MYLVHVPSQSVAWSGFERLTLAGTVIIREVFHQQTTGEWCGITVAQWQDSNGVDTYSDGESSKLFIYLKMHERVNARHINRDAKLLFRQKMAHFGRKS